MKYAVALTLGLIGLGAALAPRELLATKTVGHQARAHRLRKIDGKPLPAESRVCAEGEISTDRDPCLGADGRLDYQPGR